MPYLAVSLIRPLRPVLVALIGAWLAGCGPYYSGSGEERAHFDGTRFTNPGVERDVGAFAFLRWQLTADRSPWPDWVDNEVTDVPPARVDGDALRISYVNHATILIQTRGLNILTDPIYSERASPVQFAGPKRVRAPGVAFDDLPRIDAVVISHNHYDHLDLATLERLWDRDAPRILVPLGNDTIIRRAHPVVAAEPMDWGDRISLTDAVSVQLEPVQHWSARTGFDTNRALWGAFIIDTPDGAVYFGGDSGYGEGAAFKATAARHPPIRLALLAIGAYEPRWFMAFSHKNPEEAVRAHCHLGAAYSLGIHWGTFRLSDEAYWRPLEELVAARARYGIAADEFQGFLNGRHWWVPTLDESARAPANPVACAALAQPGPATE